MILIIGSLIGVALIVAFVIFLLGMTAFFIIKLAYKKIKEIRKSGITINHTVKLNLLFISFLIILFSCYFFLFFVFHTTEKVLVKQRFDLNGDKDIDVYDLDTLLDNWGTPKNLKTDINRDDKVDIIDFNILLSVL